MKCYFAQFGRVLKVRIMRSRRTGGNQPVAYIVFDDQHVAKIAAESMNNYLMFDKLVRCALVPFEKAPASIMKNGRKKTTLEFYRKKVNQFKQTERLEKNAIRRIKKVEEANKWLSKVGLSFTPVIINDDLASDVSEPVPEPVPEPVSEPKKKRKSLKAPPVHDDEEAPKVDKFSPIGLRSRSKKGLSSTH